MPQMRRGRPPTHGMSNTPTHSSWRSMIQRCYNPKCSKYEYYGGKGITVCDKWRFFEGFYDDMGRRPEGTSLDRIDVTGSYEPSNCRWLDARLNRAQASKNRKHFMYTKRLAIKKYSNISRIHMSRRTTVEIYPILLPQINLIAARRRMTVKSVVDVFLRNGISQEKRLFAAEQKKRRARHLNPRAAQP